MHHTIASCDMEWTGLVSHHVTSHYCIMWHHMEETTPLAIKRHDWCHTTSSCTVRETTASLHYTAWPQWCCTFSLSCVSTWARISWFRACIFTCGNSGREDVALPVGVLPSLPLDDSPSLLVCVCAKIVTMATTNLNKLTKMYTHT